MIDSPKILLNYQKKKIHNKMIEIMKVEEIPN
jgi:hypothetical protein